MFTTLSFVIEKLRFRCAAADEDKKSLSSCQIIQILMQVIFSIVNKKQTTEGMKEIAQIEVIMIRC